MQFYFQLIAKNINSSSSASFQHIAVGFDIE